MFMNSRRTDRSKRKYISFVGVPNRPDDVTVIDSSPTSITLTVTPASSGERPTGYRVQFDNRVREFYDSMSRVKTAQLSICFFNTYDVLPLPCSDNHGQPSGARHGLHVRGDVIQWSRSKRDFCCSAQDSSQR